MKLRDRVKELRRVPARELRRHPKNWRTHSRFQQDVLRGVLREVGFAGALMARELPDGSLQLLDGHLRAETSPTATLPVLVLDLSASEAEKLLLTHDPLGELAGVDDAAIGDLLRSVETDATPLRELFGKLERRTRSAADSLASAEVEITPCYQVVVEAPDESAQRALFERLRGEGYSCRVLTL